MSADKTTKGGKKNKGAMFRPSKKNSTAKKKKK